MLANFPQRIKVLFARKIVPQPGKNGFGIRDPSTRIRKPNPGSGKSYSKSQILGIKKASDPGPGSATLSGTYKINFKNRLPVCIRSPVNRPTYEQRRSSPPLRRCSPSSPPWDRGSPSWRRRRTGSRSTSAGTPRPSSPLPKLNLENVLNFFLIPVLMKF